MPDFRQTLIDTIQQNGPMLLSEWILRCNKSYYAKQTIGQDFTTAPEISPLFGEMIGLWVFNEWHQLGQPIEFSLVECGGGNGMLMADALRAILALPEKLHQRFFDALSVKLVEESPLLLDKQRVAIGKVLTHVTVDRIKLDQLPDKPAILIANEFFDALPIDQYINGIAQTIDYDIDKHTFYPVLTGDIIEKSPVRSDVMQKIARYLDDNTGSALIIDYGYLDCETGDTLQAVKDHKFTNCFTGCGTVDLTSHVDFNSLENIALQHNLSVELQTQRTFLKKLGIEIRLSKVLQHCKNPQQIMQGVNRLIALNQMGQLFKVLTCSNYQH